MAGGPIIINFSADVSEAEAGTNKLGDSLDKVGDAADDSSKQASAAAKATLNAQKETAQGIIQELKKQALTSLETWKQQQTAAGRATDEISRDYKAMQREIETSSTKASQTVAKSTTDNFEQAKTAVVGLHEKLGGMVQSIGGALGSFDGSIGSIGQSISGLASLIPGVGGLIGGALGGIAANMFQEWDKNAKDSAQAVSDMYDDMIQSGNSYLSEALIQGKIKDEINDPKKLDEITRRAELAGVSQQTALRAEAGSVTELKIVREGLLRAQNDNIAAGDKSASSVANTQLDRAIEHYSGISEQIKTATKNTELYTSTVGASTESMDNAKGAADRLKEAVTTLPNSKSITLELDDRDAQRKLREIANTPITVVGTVDLRAGNRVY